MPKRSSSKTRSSARKVGAESSRRPGSGRRVDDAPRERPSLLVWGLLAVFLAAGIAARVAALNLPRISGGTQVTTLTRWQPAGFRPFLEHDEKIYLALVEQLENGRGYTLQGHPIANEPWLVGDHYRRPLFFHPPGGVALFWLAHQVAGASGYPAVQVVCFAVFYASLVGLGLLTIRPFGLAAAVSLGSLGALTPLMSHVAGRFWLDGPLLAFSTLAAALFVYGALGRHRWLIVLAGAMLGYASLIKATAVLVAPPAVALVWALAPRESWRFLIRPGAVFVGAAVVVHLPWLIWQASVYGTLFPEWAGRPAASLVQANPYVHYLTVVRTPWVYLELLPQVMWTMGPAIVLWLAARRVRDTGRVGLALLLWIGLILGAHMWLGAAGYSKVLRYVTLAAPGGVLLFALAFSRVLDRGRTSGRLTAGALLLWIVGAAGLGFEVAQGLRTSLHDNARMDLVRPLFGVRGVDY